MKPFRFAIVGVLSGVAFFAAGVRADTVVLRDGNPRIGGLIGPSITVCRSDSHFWSLFSRSTNQKPLANAFKAHPCLRASPPFP